MIVDDYLTPIEENEDFNLKELAESVLANRYDHKQPVPEEPNYLIKIGGKGIALPASLIGVYGPPKSRKSSLMGMIVAAGLSPNHTFGEIEVNIDGEILWFDTEQNETEVKYFQDNIIRMSEQKSDDYIYEHYYAMKLRPFDELQRLAIIDKIITSTTVFNKIGLIILDGVADLMYNVNEIESSKKLVTRLTYWADKLQVPLIVALHTNKDGKDATGSLGGFLNKKASYTIKCEPEFDDGPSTVRPYFTRNGQRFLPFLIANRGEHEEFPGMPKFYDRVLETENLEFVNPSRSKGKQLDLTEEDEEIDETIKLDGKNIFDRL